ncbi:hypothetical protein C8Q75DRAFT_728556 [Abortiporus biennis]|nr:hypothetical protein C8Q75DRAFT_728556 [Abortiporus biennis]
MTLDRAFLILPEAICYHIASSPPNKAPQKTRYDNDHPWYIKITTPIFAIQQSLVWLCALADILLSVADKGYKFPLSNFVKSTTFCPHPIQNIHRQTDSEFPSSNIHLTPLFVLGVLFVLLGATIRVICFQTLGRFFTFELTIMKSHKLITSGPYNIVRHPSYTGILFMIFGSLLVNFTKGGWVIECGIIVQSGSRSGWMRMIQVGLTGFWGWWFFAAVYRAKAEDKELKKLFGKEWDMYAQEVRWWFLPGVI